MPHLPDTKTNKCCLLNFVVRYIFQPLKINKQVQCYYKNMLITRYLYIVNSDFEADGKLEEIK